MSAIPDQNTADAFATSWNNLPIQPIYTEEQVRDWLTPISIESLSNLQILELGCGNGSILYHILNRTTATVTGVDLGASVNSARMLLETLARKSWQVLQHDLVSYESNPKVDCTLCIGVLHHLHAPKDGFSAVLRNTKAGGLFHCWVYAREGNTAVIWIVEPIRRIACKLPWRISKYLIAAPLATIVYMGAQIYRVLPAKSIFSKLPLFDYLRWLAKREWHFCHHVVFDQIVTPQTVYIPKTTIKEWLLDQRIDPSSTYILNRNGNSWKFGGRLKIHS